MCELPVIRFTDEELDLFACGGAKRAVKCIAKKRTPAEGAGHFNDWQYTIEGALTEAALAKHLGLYPTGFTSIGASDCSGHEVRSSPHHDAPLRMMQKDKDDAPYWHITGVNGSYTIRGWIYGRDAKRGEWWGVWKRPEHPCYWVPQSALNSPYEPPTITPTGPEDCEAKPEEENELMITLSIDVSKLDKTRFKRVNKRNGELAIYCDLILLETPQSDYGDYMVKQSVTKEEREAKIQMPILGNAKSIIPVKDGMRQVREAVNQTSKKPTLAQDWEGQEGEDIPF
jgi:hypothetical protein